ncbi:MAG: filamentous hemagglutinin N-terminal domain-containing protein [Cyanobacteria bacterium P01_E01_bin.42]
MSDRWFWEVGKLGLIASLAVAGSRSAIAQIVPDSTLGNERSVVVPINAQLEHIQGGALRGSNLFHSFQEFNVQNGHSAYFVNPALVENIFSRVTGTNVSEIFGTLGVLGEANLYLINPNGIIFGENASLDITGSFVATTASRLVFGDGSEYSAVNPEIPGMIINNVPIQISLQFEGEPAAIINLGNLSTGESLTLAGGNLDLEGELVAGEDLTLTAEDTVKIRDSENSHFIAAAGNNLLIQGNEKVDIFALHHAESGLFSGGDMVLRSNNAVIGDAHYYSGGSFRIEELDGDLGELESPNDPILRVRGDIFINAYRGASLHIFAGGKVEIPNGIQITGADVANGLTEIVTLSDGSTIEIDGKTNPTVDIRAGVDPTFIGNPLLTGTGVFIRPININASSSADINIGIIVTDIVLGNGGTVFLTNLYKPDLALQGGDITVDSIDPRDRFGGGSVIIDSRSNLNINGNVDVSAFRQGNNNYLGNGGNIDLLADGDIKIHSAENYLKSRGNLGGNITLSANGNIEISDNVIESYSYNSQQLNTTPTGGNIFLDAQSIFINNGTQLSTITLGQANAGNVIIQANHTVRFQGVNPQGKINAIGSAVEIGGVGNGGEINITTGILEFLDGAVISTYTSGQGNAGNVTINATNALNTNNFVRFQGEANSGGSRITSTVEETGVGDAGEINIITENLELLNGGRISNATQGQGSVGNINIQADFVHLQGTDNQGRKSRIISQVAPIGAGNAGNLNINTNILEISGGAKIENVTFGQGNGGNLDITAHDYIRIQEEDRHGNVSGIDNQVSRNIVGNAGEINIATGVLELLNGGEISTIIWGKGEGGNLTINASDRFNIKGENSYGLGSVLRSQVQTTEASSAGEIKIITGTLEVLDGGQISGSTVGLGNVSNLTINATDLVRFKGTNSQGRGSGIISQVEAIAVGNGGEININTEILEVLDGAAISINTKGQGNAGHVTINANNTVRIQGRSNRGVSGIVGEVEATGVGNGGEININTPTLQVLDGAFISTSIEGKGKAGNITLNAANTVRIQGEDRSGSRSRILSQVETTGIGNGGEVKISTEILEVLDGARIATDTFGQGNAGKIDVTANQLNLTQDSQVTSRTYSNSNAGNITLNVIDRLNIEGENSGLFTNTEPNSTGNGGDIFLQTDNLFLNNNAQISAATEGQGKAGDLNITANTLEANNGSQFRTNTITSKDAGDITLNIANNVRLTGNNTGLFAQTQGEGDAGDILVNTPELNLLQGAIIRASTSDRGNSGDITVNAPTSIFLGGNSQLSVETSNAGKAGNITLTTPNLTVEELARITATATATATTQQQGGSITVNASQMNLAGTVGIFAETQGQVPAGTLTLQPDNNQNNLDIDFQQGAQISASTSGSGTGGSLFVFAPDTIDISGDGTLAVETRSTGNAGNIEMRAANLNLSNGAKISASTSGEGQGGNIDLSIARHIQLSDRSTGILASTAADSRGNGGNINIQTAYLNAADGVEIGVNSQGMGTGGDIDIQGDRIDLNNSQITAETRSTQGGNIDLTVGDLLLMRHGSKISTTAGTAQAGGDGGNITINAENGFLVGPPGEDNDITANAFEGNGGNINITAQEIFGLKFRDQLTPRSDITASSEFGLDGTVQLNTLGIDPNNGLTNLPEDQNDPEVRQGCSQGGANSSSLTVQGIGGAPDNPDDMLTPEIDDEFISLDELETDGTIAENTIALPDEKRSPLAFSCQ